MYRPSLYNLGRVSMRKWMMPRYMFNESKYPPFTGGSGYVMDKEAAKCLLNASKVTISYLTCSTVQKINVLIYLRISP